MVLIVAAVVGATSPAAAQLGVLGRAVKAGKDLRDLQITADEERQIGERVSAAIRERYGVVQDKAVHRYVGLVGSVLVQASARPDAAWHFIVLDTDGVNAFAAPGGFVHITRGALALIEDEAELAGVLGHEIVHITEQHTIKAIRKQKMADMGMDVAPGPGGLSQAVIDRLADQATGMVLAGFGRAEEIESDREGIALANKVGYAPLGLSEFLQRLADRNKGATEKQGLFASHPETSERIDRLKKQVEKDKLTGTAVLDARYRKFISYRPTPQAEIAQVADGAAGLAGGSGAPAKKDEGKGDDKSAKAGEPKKKSRFGLGNLLKPSSEEKKSAEVTGSAAGRGVDRERNAKGGDNPALVAVTLTPADLEAFRKEGSLK